jgi:hypothetical protein
MKNILPILVCVFVFGFVGYAVYNFGKQPASALASSYTCLPNGSYASPPSGDAVLTNTDISKIDAATAWLTSMTGTTTTTVTNSTITPTVNHPESYQGSIDGTYNLDGRGYATDAVISINSPVVLTDDYRGVVNGHVLPAPEQWRWIIQAYKRVDGVINQVPVQALADGTTGDFSIDLSGISANTQGEWMFGILDANNSYSPYGSKWPDANYVGLEVQQFVVTDSIYYWSTTSARTNGTFTFPNSNTGQKLYRLVDTTTDPDEILAEYIQPTGLIRSYLYQPGETGYGTAMENRSFVYDQAVALNAAISVGNNDLAKLLTDGLLRLQTTSGSHTGGFIFAGPQLSPSYTDPLYRTGAHAIATDALLTYIQNYPNDPNKAAYIDAAKKALIFLNSTLSTSGATTGLYLGGFGQYSGSPQTFDPSYVIEWASTEHNIDSWHTLVRASKVLGDEVVNYTLQASNLETAIQTVLYNSSERRLNQGFNSNVPDTADPLDVNSWGAIQLYATGHIQEAQDALNRVSLFEHTVNTISGYAPFYDSPGYPGATPTIWYEGSFGVALAQYKLGNYTAYRNLLNALDDGQETDGSYRYATNPDTQYEIGSSKSVASTGWYIVATAGRDVVWNSCLYTPPVAPVDPTSPSASPVPVSPKPQTSKPTQPQVSLNPSPNSNTPDTTTPEIVSDTPASVNAPTDVTNQPGPTNETTSESEAARPVPMPVIIGGGLILLASIVTLIIWAIRRNH